MKNYEYLIDHDEVKEIMAVSGSTIYRLRKAGHFPQPIQIFARKLVWKLSDIQQFVDSHKASNESLH